MVTITADKVSKLSVNILSNIIEK
ncbi:hypothetical protein Gohar_026620 [Gossypium harknessii]|uniref:Uncharacterized protein n=1 Tax=Gossypium harknessii TaxID=34285 RepID=A0A7J9HUW1_9ROSI|nr:hypothetical protein [Gossypium harknessii]